MALNSMAVKRIQKELNYLAEFGVGISVEVVNENFTDIKGKISGLPGTPYEGGHFVLDIKLDQTYPFKPPKIRFVTKIWHPNISSKTGTICLNDPLKKKAWTPTMTLASVLLSLQALLECPDTDDPLEHVIAEQCKNNPEMFQLTARYWAQVFADAPGSNPDFDDKIEKVIAMGVNEESALVALSTCSWDLQATYVFVVRNHSLMSRSMNRMCKYFTGKTLF